MTIIYNGLSSKNYVLLTTWLRTTHYYSKKLNIDIVSNYG